MHISLRTHIQLRFDRWLSKRIPAQRHYTLNNRRIFIFLSKAGYAYCALLILLLVIAVNYQNNMVFALLFLLCSLFVVTLLHSYKNLAGLKIEYLNAKNAFVGDSVDIQLRLSSPKQSKHYSVLAQWGSESEVIVDVEKTDERVANLHLAAKKRGVFIPPRLLIESFYPFGLFRTWTWLLLSVDALVYPLPIKCRLPASDNAEGVGEGEVTATPGNDDFYGFKTYQQGDSLKKVHWPGYAKGQGMHTKEFGAETYEQLTVNLNSFSGDVETGLSRACYWIMQYHAMQLNYSLLIDGVIYGPDKGEAFTNRLLAALALHKQPGVNHVN